VRASAAAIEAAAAAVEEAAAGCDDIGGRHRHRRSSWARAVRSARSRELEAVDHAENAKAALASLQDGLSEAMAEDDRAQRAIQSAVAAVLRPVARSLLDQAWQFSPRVFETRVQRQPRALVPALNRR
jgi:hypothetical protein